MASDRGVIKKILQCYLSFLGLSCCTQTFSSCREQRPLSSVVHRLPIAVAFLTVERLLQHTQASVVAGCELTSCGWQPLEF